MSDRIEARPPKISRWNQTPPGRLRCLPQATNMRTVNIRVVLGTFAVNPNFVGQTSVGRMIDLRDFLVLTIIT